ncbi:MAG: asparagine--tRNA ligase [Mailhella sp.]|nr:asparagine--tRNA ligase [Mailhella sp.]
MQGSRIRELLAASHAQGNVEVRGWVRTRRDSKGFAFLEVNDGSCLKNIQCIIDEGTEAWKDLEGVNTGASVCIRGALVESPGKGQKWEVHAASLEVFGLADPSAYPLQKKRHSDEFLRTIAHLRPRTNKYGAVFRIRSEAAWAVHDYFRARGFYYVHTPLITGSDCEGAGEMFRVTTQPQGASGAGDDFFGRPAALTVSGQLEGEAFACALGRIYTFGPTFRAEHSNTPRHAAEFWMIEPEAAFSDILDHMELAEGLVAHCVRHVLEHCPDDLGLLDRFVCPGLEDGLRGMLEGGFARISYRDAVRLLQESGRKFEYPVSFGCDLQTEHERFLAEEHFKSPVTVYDYPGGIKPFYMRQNDDGETVAAMDLLVPRIGELIGGSQREERPDRLEKRMAELGQRPEDYWWYADLRRYGTVPHSGFGMGFERLVMLLTGVSNIRDVLPFPRTPGNLEF